MEDMDAFERQLATVMQQGGRASLPIDATAIVHSAVTSAPTERWTVITRRLWGDSASASTEKGFSMFSALKFVAAAAIVALFGGFLLAGVLTTQQAEEAAPAAVTDSPAPMATEEPGKLTLEVSGLVGMEGLELAAQIGSSPQPHHYYWQGGAAHRSIDASPFSGELMTFPVGEGTHELVVLAGEPPCAVIYLTPLCAESDPEYVCSVRLDVPPGEHIGLTIGGLPVYEPSPADDEGSGIGPGCLITEMRHSEPPMDEGIQTETYDDTPGAISASG